MDGSDGGSESHAANALGGLGPASSLGSVGGRWGDNDATTEEGDDDVESNCNNYFNTSSHLQVGQTFFCFQNQILTRNPVPSWYTCFLRYTPGQFKTCVQCDCKTNLKERYYSAYLMQL